MKYFHALILISMIILFSAGCSQNTSSSGSGGGREYFPNTDGYSWSYRMSMSGTTETATARMTFTGTTTAGGTTVQIWRTESFYTTGATTIENLIKVTDSSVTQYGTLVYPSTIPSTVIAFPLNIGSSWYTYGTVEAIVTAQENVIVPSGTFNNCYKISSTQGSNSSDLWLGKNVGIVKMLTTSIYGTYTLELISRNF